jgi:DNA-binding transcriptional MocR family regulator
MTDYKTLPRNRLREIAGDLEREYEDFKRQGLALDMTRGKPSREQLYLALGLLECVGRDDYRSAGGVDCRNYGGVDGLPEAKALFAEVLEVAPEEIIVAGNSSLTLMHDIVVQGLLGGVPGGSQPWGALREVKFLCPSPGYDRHFTVCQRFGIQMLTIDMTPDGPDMKVVEALVAEDESIKGMWCVPKYSNPTGVTFSDHVVSALARMPTKASDFRIFWDNAYVVHDLSDTPDLLQDLLGDCKRAGNPDRPFIFGSTSKVSFAGAGVAMVAGSERNMGFVRQALAAQTIGPDKLNQLRHVRFFKDRAGIEAHMRKHAALLKPKFEAVQEILEKRLRDTGLAHWSRPNGGYFVSVDTPDGCAREVVAMAGEAGIKFTQAGATFPYGKDPRDRNIRVAPSMPPLEEVRTAIEVLALCIQRVGIAKLLGSN